MARETKKPTLFISHISEEKEVAGLLKAFFENAFLGAIRVFVSSNEKSIPYGTRWLNQITDALQRCEMMLVLCSRKSVQRPWINYEAGFGSGRNVNVIPICYAGQDKGQLPAPLSFYQGLNLLDAGVLKILLEQIANAINMQCPAVDCTDLLEQIRQQEIRYVFWDDCNAAFERLETCAPGVVQALKACSAGESCTVTIVGRADILAFENLRKSLFADGAILFISGQEECGLDSHLQDYACYKITPQSRFFEEILLSPEFRYK